ncbi:MAG: hypothetical protein R3C11_07255 [Planctomycetaceae bacterium]
MPRSSEVPEQSPFHPLTTFLGRWGLTATDEDAVIDAIIAEVTRSISTEIRASGNNGDFDTTGVNGDFDIVILNSRDDADPFGQDNVSRVIIGGTVAEFGIPTIGLAESIDPAQPEETAVVLLDFLSEVASDPNSLNGIPLAAGSATDLIGTAVGNITSHEAGTSSVYSTRTSSIQRTTLLTRGEIWPTPSGWGLMVFTAPQTTSRWDTLPTSMCQTKDSLVLRTPSTPSPLHCRREVDQTREQVAAHHRSL